MKTLKQVKNERVEKIDALAEITKSLNIASKNLDYPEVRRLKKSITKIKG